jgi:transposase-like protein
MSDTNEETASKEIPSTSTEVYVSPKKKRYTPAFKIRLIEEADRCETPGERAALCRREGIYFSTLADFRKQKARGLLDGKQAPTFPKEKTDPKVLQELMASEREVRRLKRELERARALLDLQKKVSELMGLTLEPIE